MKLRNKKTGEIIKDAQYRNYSTKDGFVITTPTDKYSYKSLKEFCEDWEDVPPTEPLIKDAGVREVMRLWAKVNLIPTNATTIEYHFADSLCGKESEFWDNNLHIMFYGKIAPNAVHGGIYTIAELCGEEEAPEPIEPMFIDLDGRVKEKGGE